MLRTSGEDGIALWRKQQDQHQLEVARKLGLPIGQEVEVWLRGGVRLRGRLRLEELFHPESKEGLKVAVDGTVFSVDELESCIRL